MKKTYIFYSISIFVFYFLATGNVYAQDIDSTIVAKIMLVTKINTKDNKPIAALSVTFINTSDQDIYIPELFNKVRAYPIGGKIKTYLKTNLLLRPTIFG